MLPHLSYPEKSTSIVFHHVLLLPFYCSKLEMSHGTLCSIIFDELGNTKLFGTTIFGTRHISTAQTATLILASSATILSWSMLSDDLALWDSLANVSMTSVVGASVAECINAGLCWGSWPCSLTLSSSWAVVGIWLNVSGRLEGPSPEVFDTTKRLMSSPKCRSVEVINNPVRPGSNHREVNCINYREQ